MPWSSSSCTALREQFVRRVQRACEPFAVTCRFFGVSRRIGYKWCRRYHLQGTVGLVDQSRRPQPSATAHQSTWHNRVKDARVARPHWGAKKLRALLRELYPRQHLPAQRTIGRWLKALGMTRQRMPRRALGPSVPHPGLTQARRANQVWTLDFKGWFRTADGIKQEPLTVRDAKSRYLLAIELLPNQEDAGVRRVMRRLFSRQGLPTAIRVDNGVPFASVGPLGLSRLSVWWLRLGIRVEFTRRARPGDNAAHEQMHSRLKAEVLTPPAANRREQQRRCDQWRKDFNECRPHEGLGQRTPASCYRRSKRRMPQRLPNYKHVRGGLLRRVRSTGSIKWEGKLCFIGRAFVGEQVVIKASKEQRYEVWLGRLKIGSFDPLHRAHMSPARWLRKHELSLKVLPMSWP